MESDSESESATASTASTTSTTSTTSTLFTSDSEEETISEDDYPLNIISTTDFEEMNYPVTGKNMFTDDEFLYNPDIPENMPLSPDLRIEVGKSIQVDLCFYLLSKASSQDPYLAFLMSGSTFPCFQYNATIPNKQLENNLPETETLFFNEIFKHIVHYFDLKSCRRFLGSKWRKSVKGFLWGDRVKVVIDATYFIRFRSYELISNLKTIDTEWVTLHEIIHLKKLRDKPIHKDVFDFFMREDSDPYLYIKNKNGSNCYVPFVMFSCEWSNMFQTTQEVHSILPPKSLHPVLGSMYFFSNAPLHNATYPQQRYIVYPTQTIYLTDLKPGIQGRFHEKIYNSVYFQQNKEPIWGIFNASFFHEF